MRPSSIPPKFVYLFHLLRLFTAQTQGLPFAPWTGGAVDYAKLTVPLTTRHPISGSFPAKDSEKLLPEGSHASSLLLIECFLLDDEDMWN